MTQARIVDYVGDIFVALSSSTSSMRHTKDFLSYNPPFMYLPVRTYYCLAKTFVQLFDPNSTPCGLCNLHETRHPQTHGSRERANFNSAAVSCFSPYKSHSYWKQYFMRSATGFKRVGLANKFRWPRRIFTIVGHNTTPGDEFSNEKENYWQ